MCPMFELAKAQLLERNDLSLNQLDDALSSLMTHEIDYGELYFEYAHQESWSLEDGIIKGGSFSIESGVGVRAVSGEKTGFAYSDDIRADALLEAGQAARAIARAGQERRVSVTGQRDVPQLYLPDNPIESLDEAAKIALLRRADEVARAADPRVTQVMASLSGTHQFMLVTASDGTLAADVRPLVRLNVSVVVEHKGKREQAGSGGGGRFTYAELADNDRAAEYAREAVRQALVNLEAEPAPAGSMTVVLGPGWPGILLHEAIGHGLEGDFNRKGTSAFAGRIGDKVAGDECTIVDDGTLARRRGSLTVDDEGTPSQNTVLIENGILKAYMMDKTNARLTGGQSTGNGRRQGYNYLPLPRMTNTYMLAGQHDPAEIIASVDKGIYAVNFGGGQVDITSGKFVFSASESYLIENGKVTRPVKGATLIGNGADALTRVSMVGKDLALDAGVGVCGKEGQGVPVGVGQPTLRLDELTVGGTQAG
ncbi:metalloprotease TldD [Granulosicoccaceae sp. 1_MG-2023]|nr:metalloprotease TldD [Granulosicoccaceae sp. 1_MG-2023]